MLVLTRREGEAIVFDGGIRVVVLSCDRRGVRLGIEAPADISVLRAELLAEIASANSAAIASGRQPDSLPGPLRSVRVGTAATAPGLELQPQP
jgi:carbon storage regulator